MPILVEVVTQEGMLFAADGVDMVIIPGREGEMGVLPHHTPMLTTLNYGELRIKKGIAEESFIIFGGIAEIRPGHVTVLADMAEPSCAADAIEAEKARSRVQDLLRVGVADEIKPSLLDELRRAEVMLKVARKLHSRRSIHIRTVDETSEEYSENGRLLNSALGRERL